MARMSYDAVYAGPPDRVHALLIDEAFLNACLDEAEALSRDVRVQRSGDAVAVRVVCSAWVFVVRGRVGLGTGNAAATVGL